MATEICGVCAKPAASCACARETPATDPLANPPMRTPKHGRGKLRSGGTNTGGAPGWFRAKLRELGSHPRTLGYIEECLAGEHGPVAALAAWGHCLRFGLGDASKIEFSGRLATIDMKLLPNDVIEALAAPGGNPALVLRRYLTSGALPSGRDDTDEDADGEVGP